MRGFPPRSIIRYPGGYTIGSNSVSTTFPLPKPSTVVDNTLLLAVMAASAVVTYTVASTGFNATLGAGSSGGFGVFWKFIPVASAETATSYTFNVGLANHKGFIVPILGCDPTNPIEEIIRGAAASGSPTSPTITPDQTGLTLVSVMQMITGGAGQTIPSGMTGFVDLTSAAVRGTGLELLGPATATGTRVWPVTGNNGAASVTLRPAA